MVQRKKISIFLVFLREGEGDEEEEESKLLSLILGVSSVRISRAKSESPSTQQGLRVCTKNEGFH